MIRTLCAASLTGLGLVGLAQAETKSFPVETFTQIDASAGIEVAFSIGTAPSVVVENDKGDFDDIDVFVRGDTLVLKRKKKSWGWGKRARYSVTVTTETLSGVEVSSGAEVVGSGMRGDVIRVQVSSGADAELSDVSGTEVRLESSSGSDLDIAGTCQRVWADSSSGSDIEARDLICDTAEADASSGSDITLHAKSRLTADASSGADITVYGGPTEVDSDKSSGGSVSIRG